MGCPVMTIHAIHKAFLIIYALRIDLTRLIRVNIFGNSSIAILFYVMGVSVTVGVSVGMVAVEEGSSVNVSVGVTGVLVGGRVLVNVIVGDGEFVWVGVCVRVGVMKGV